MKTVCIGMDERGQFFVGMKPEGGDMGMGAEQPGEDMGMEGAEMDEGSESYMQPVASMAEAFQTARSMLTEGDEASRQSQFDAGVSRVLGPNPKPNMGKGAPPMRGGMKGGM